MDGVNDSLEFISDDIGAGMDALAGAANAAGNLFWMNNPLPKHHKAAISMQRFHKRKSIQIKDRQHKAASKLQATFRGKMARKDLERGGDGHGLRAVTASARKASMRKKSFVAEINKEEMRPGLEWLAKLERDSLREERLARARNFTDKARRAASFGNLEDADASSGLGRTQQEKYADMLDLQVSRAKERNRLRSQHISGVGIVYTRANPSGSKGNLTLEDASKRMRHRKARAALPAAMPPQADIETAANHAYKKDQVRRRSLVGGDPRLAGMAGPSSLGSESVSDFAGAAVAMRRRTMMAASDAMATDTGVVGRGPVHAGPAMRRRAQSAIDSLPRDGPPSFLRTGTDESQYALNYEDAEQGRSSEASKRRVKFAQPSASSPPPGLPPQNPERFRQIASEMGFAEAAADAPTEEDPDQAGMWRV